MQYELEPGNFVINPSQKTGELARYSLLLRIRQQLILKMLEKK